MIGKTITGTLNAGTRMSRKNSLLDWAASIGPNGASRIDAASAMLRVRRQPDHRLFERRADDLEIAHVDIAGEERAQDRFGFGGQKVDPASPVLDVLHGKAVQIRHRLGFKGKPPVLDARLENARRRV